MAEHERNKNEKHIRKTHSVPREQSNDQRAGRVAYRQYTQILSYNAI